MKSFDYKNIFSFCNFASHPWDGILAKGEYLVFQHFFFFFFQFWLPCGVWSSGIRSQLQQPWILNPLCQAGIELTSQHSQDATVGTPFSVFFHLIFLHPLKIHTWISYFLEGCNIVAFKFCPYTSKDKELYTILLYSVYNRLLYSVKKIFLS